MRTFLTKGVEIRNFYVEKIWPFQNNLKRPSSTSHWYSAGVIAKLPLLTCIIRTLYKSNKLKVMCFFLQIRSLLLVPSPLLLSIIYHKLAYPSRIMIHTNHFCNYATQVLNFICILCYHCCMYVRISPVQKQNINNLYEIKSYRLQSS